MRQQRPNARAQFARKHLEKYGFSPGELLGAGFHGTVFQYGPSRAIKLTDSWGEAYFFLWLMEIGGHPGFPRADQVKRVGLRKGVASFVVVREEVPTLVDPCEGRFHWAAEELFRGRERDSFGHSDEERLSSSLSRTDFILKSPCVLPAHHTLWGNLVETVKWALDRGCRLPSLHEGNLGIRGDVVVIRDLSNTWVPFGWAKGRKIP